VKAMLAAIVNHVPSAVMAASAKARNCQLNSGLHGSAESHSVVKYGLAHEKDISAEISLAGENLNRSRLAKADNVAFEEMAISNCESVKWPLNMAESGRWRGTAKITRNVTGWPGESRLCG
jgi:hypothetical protein